MTNEQFEFCMAIETYKKVNKRMYPTWTEILEVVHQLGYRKVLPRDIKLNNVPEPDLFKPEIDRGQLRNLLLDSLDPEVPVLTIEDLGVLRDVAVEHGPDGPTVTVTVTPTYSGCPAMATMRDDLVHRLTDAGYDVRVEIALAPAWSSDWITPRGRWARRSRSIPQPS